MDNSVCGKQPESKTDFTEEEAMEYLSNDCMQNLYWFYAICANMILK